MPTPTPAPSPTPFVSATATQPLAEDLIELVGLQRTAHMRLLLFGVELVLVVLFFGIGRTVLTRLVERAGRRLAEREDAHGDHGRAARLRTLTGLLQSTTDFVLGFLFLVSVLSLFGVNVAAIVGTASVAGLAFGFGAQKLVKDVITGYFILLEDQYAVGDYVTIGTVSGIVEEVGMRITRIRDDDGKLYILSNGDIAQVCNHSRGPVTGSFDLAVSNNADLAAATAALNTKLAAASATLGLFEAARVEGISAQDAAKTTLKIIFKTGPGKRPVTVLPALREAARAAVDENQIALG